jgi:hypothetical protein
MKFNNFSKILDNYYEDPKYYPALHDLWINNICIEELKEYSDKGEIFINKVKSLTDKYDEWPDDFKKSFYKLVRNTSNTEAFKLKELLEKKYNKYYKLTKELLKLKKNYEYEKVDNIVPNAAGIIASSILSYFSIIYNIGSFYTDPIFEKAKEAKGLLIKTDILSEIGEELKDSGNSQFTPLQVFNDLKRLMQNDIGESSYSLCAHWDSYEWYPSDPYDYRIKGPTFTFKNGDIDNTLNLEDQVDSLLKDELSSWGILAASFLNLGWSIYNLIEVDKECDKLKEYDKELEDIRKDFYDHRQKLQDLPETLEEAIKYINEILLDIKSNQVRLKQHIDKIMESIKNQESKQTQSLIGMGISTVLGVLSIGKAISAGVGLMNMLLIGSNITIVELRI